MHHECARCHRAFSRKQHLTNHLNKNYPCGGVVGDEIANMRREIESLRKELSDIRRLEPATIQVNGNNNNTTNNEVNHNEVHIHINNFGHDDNRFLTLEDIKEVAKKDLGEILAEYVRKVNCSAEHKENHNLKRCILMGVGSQWKRQLR